MQDNSSVYLDTVAVRREWVRVRMVVWASLAVLAAGACALVWSGVTMIGLGNPDTVYLGKCMVLAGVVVVVIGSQVRV